MLKKNMFLGIVHITPLISIIFHSLTMGTNGSH